ncbi:unnamed protein product, partial [Staurois parvus]
MDGSQARVGIVRAAWYRRSKQRIVGVTSQVQQVAGSAVRGSGRRMVRQARGSTGDSQQRSGSKQGQQRGRNTGYQV